jgi:hypothetical protein
MMRPASGFYASPRDIEGKRFAMPRHFLLRREGAIRKGNLESLS